MKKSTKTLVCFGEMLWDILPTGKMPGGAPMNVAIHWQKAGNKAHLISRIGSDSLGEELLAFLDSMALDSAFIQHDQTYPTGTVGADTSDPAQVVYEIRQPVAWDFISPAEEAVQAVKNATFFVFGSLAARSEESKRTLNQLLEQATCPVFDCNLRQPFYSREVVEELLHYAQIIKLNESEIAQMATWFGCSGTYEDVARQLAAKFSLSIVCLTLGAEGSAALVHKQWVACPGFTVEVVDTIGSGDAFLASFLAGIADDQPLTEVLAHANAVGALVASKSGAVPPILNDEIQALLRPLHHEPIERFPSN